MKIKKLPITQVVNSLTSQVVSYYNDILKKSLHFNTTIFINEFDGIKESQFNMIDFQENLKAALERIQILYKRNKFKRVIKLNTKDNLAWNNVNDYDIKVGLENSDTNITFKIWIKYYTSAKWRKIAIIDLNTLFKNNK